MSEKILDQLVAMTRTLGQPQNNYVIIGEGNTSHRADADTFWIKASGHGMNGISADGFVQVQLAPILALLDSQMSGSALQAAMQAAVIGSTKRPSVEVTFHAALLHGCDVSVIGHTHPLAVNSILCSDRAEQFANNRLFPDEAVLCGPCSVFVPYVDPGLALALAIRERVRGYMEEFGEAPKVILLQNHGLIALGQTPTEVLNVTAMCVKAAGIFAGACAVGEPVFMSKADIMHIYRRPDEIYRRKLFVG
ncbi:MAG TPA: class II aldolase/adducin family protein [Phototrophicaceae bacterium]|nr:class II aldolase/adducin family protein [Phototrophicaceae bacterium]